MSYLMWVPLENLFFSSPVAASGRISLRRLSPPPPCIASRRRLPPDPPAMTRPSLASCSPPPSRSTAAGRDPPPPLRHDRCRPLDPPLPAVTRLVASPTSAAPSPTRRRVPPPRYPQAGATLPACCSAAEALTAALLPLNATGSGPHRQGTAQQRSTAQQHGAQQHSTAGARTAAPKGWAEHNSHTEATAEHRSIGSCRKRN